MERIYIKPEREYFREIVTKISSNTYAIPAFQRDFVWKKGQVLDLFDSIQKGYPIGSIILWKPKEAQHPAIKDVISDKVKDISPSDYYILDGRQRCTAFFGCVLDWEEKDPRFCLLYDVENDGFVYKAKKNNLGVSAFKVSDIYDTFKMLGILQAIMQSNIDETVKKQYVNRIKEINTILQQYELGEILIENCTLEESSTVFSRINSKGTDISKVEMLQAQTYKSRESILLVTEIDNIINSLSSYGFSGIKPDDVLSCYARYVNKNHYDNNLLQAISNSDIKSIIPQLKQDIQQSVEFLYNECGVISYRLLPYNKQFFAIASFFKEHKNPTEAQLKELKKWFFYSSYLQLFQNGSLSNIRPIFNRLDEFVNGNKNTICEYEPIDIDTTLDFNFKPSSAMSDFLILMQILERKSLYPNENLEYIGEYKVGGNKPVNSFSLLSTEDRKNIVSVLKGCAVNYDSQKYMLTDDIVEKYLKGDRTLFYTERRKLIVAKAKSFLEELGLEFAPTEATNGNFSISDFLSDFSELNYEEQRELCEVLSQGVNAHSVIFDISHVDADTFSVSYSTFEVPYVMSSDTAHKCLDVIEDKYCNGEDAASYFSWRIALEHE